MSYSVTLEGIAEINTFTIVTMASSMVARIIGFVILLIILFTAVKILA